MLIIINRLKYNEIVKYLRDFELHDRSRMTDNLFSRAGVVVSTATADGTI